MDLTVVVPCFNEEHGLPRLHAALTGVLPELAAEYEIVVVDDGSTDRTLLRARALAASDPHFRYVSLSRNFGKEAAVLAGLQRARGARVAIMDADLQHPPRLLGRMLALLDSGHDQVVACRERDGEPLRRTVPASVFYRLLNRFCDVRVHDGAGDYRVLSQRAVRALLALPEQHRFSKGLFAWIGFDTAYVPFRHVARHSGRSKWTWRALAEYGVDGLISFHRRPLRSAVYLGGLIAAAAAGRLVCLALGGAWGREALLTGILWVSGVQLLCLGALGEYAGRIHLESKRRPHFLVKETDGPQVVAGISAEREDGVLCGAPSGAV